MPEADVVVAGAGHNSLITAAFLARAGLEVIVLEARELIGGNTITEELTLPGFKHDSCSSAHVLIQSNPLIRNNELQLDTYGLNYIHTDPAVVMPFDDGSSLTMWLDRHKTAEEIARFSIGDARAYLAMLDEWEGLKRIHGLVGNSPPAQLSLESDAARDYARLDSMSARDVVFERFEHPNVRTFILWLSFATIQPPARPGTGILPFAVTAGRQEFGWTIPEGGSGALPAALGRLIAAHGGSIVTSAPVEQIVVEDGRTTGVTTADGTTYTARRAVVSTIHVAQLERTLPPGSPCRRNSRGAFAAGGRESHCLQFTSRLRSRPHSGWRDDEWSRSRGHSVSPPACSSRSRHSTTAALIPTTHGSSSFVQPPPTPGAPRTVEALSRCSPSLRTSCGAHGGRTRSRASPMRSSAGLLRTWTSNPETS